MGMREVKKLPQGLGLTELMVGVVVTGICLTIAVFAFQVSLVSAEIWHADGVGVMRQVADRQSNAN